MPIQLLRLNKKFPGWEKYDFQTSNGDRDINEIGITSIKDEIDKTIRDYSIKISTSAIKVRIPINNLDYSLEYLGGYQK